MEFIEMNGLTYFLHLRENSAAFERQRNPGRNEFTERLDCGKVKPAVSLVENKKSCGISFEYVGQKVYKRLIRV